MEAVLTALVCITALQHSPGMLFSSLALHIWLFQMSVRIYSIRLALHRKLNTRK